MTITPITMTASVWLGQYSGVGPQDLKQGLNANDLTFLKADVERDYWLQDGYTFAGTAEIQFTPLAPAAIVESKIAALRAQQTKAIADAHATSVKLEGQIQKLLAIGCDAPALNESKDDDLPF